jgi:hypothetical protein
MKDGMAFGTTAEKTLGQPNHQPQERRLSGPVRTDQFQRMASRDIEIEDPCGYRVPQCSWSVRRS